MRDFDVMEYSKVNSTGRFNEGVRGKIHRGISSTRAEEKMMLKDYSFDAKKAKGYSNSHNQQIAGYITEAYTKTKRTTAIDLIGKNLRQSLNHTPNDDYF